MSQTFQHPRKRKYRSDGTPTWVKRTIDGPGVWASCVKGKEKQTVGELCDLFESLSSELWPIEGRDQTEGHCASEDEDVGDLEAQVAREVAAIKRPRVEKRFVTCQTNTPCVVFISCRPPVDPVKLIVTHAENVRKTGVTRTKYTHRLIPVSGSCIANLPEIQSLCRRTFPSFFAQDDGNDPSQTRKYKIDLRMRNHNTLDRLDIIKEVAKCMPDNYTVDLDGPEVFVLVEVFKSVCGVSILRDYYKLQKFNVMTLANEKNMVDNFKRDAGRVQGKEADDVKLTEAILEST
ncbi:hypothetical protein PAXINDRAFT_136074 [Paxillus involutus ATCC 200175]|uniref:THUMP domain-containing protein n=1 Tax=Paxillus involutus ATCC 200175 TaxID=664439 RepID=A0A0C9TCW5_PAXIN|nr:hypothetical protein PAXINDRAFT_136074 [Paxillus involutus ATCC 200175]